MNRLLKHAAALAVFVLVALPFGAPVLAAEAPALREPSVAAVVNQDGHDAGPTAQQDSQGDVVPRVVWMLGGVAASAVVMGLLYLFKRRVGGFPKNPAWVAPITIMPSSELPGDRDPHEAGSHEPAPGH